MIVSTCMRCGSVYGATPSDHYGRSHGYCSDCEEVERIRLDEMFEALEEEEEVERIRLDEMFEALEEENDPC